MNWLNYHHLFYFYIIAQEGSIAKASRKLHVGASALSIQLRQLEEALGCKLFVRKSQRLVLTEAGNTAFDYARAIFKLGGELLEAVKSGRKTSVVRLEIGILDSVPKSVAHQLVAAALEIENCYVSVSEAGSLELLQGLLAHKLHLVLTNSHAPISPQSDFFSRCVGDFPVIVCGAPKYDFVVSNFPESLHGQPFILPTPHSKLRSDLEHFFELIHCHPKFICESQESELDKRLAISGHALIATPVHGVRTQLAEKKLISFGTLGPVREQMWLTGVRRHIANPAAAKLLESFVVQ